MAKVTIAPLANLDNPSVAVANINANFNRIATALENTLSRDGTTPNDMEDELDMDGQRIIGLPAPTSDTEPARHGDIQTYVDDAEASAASAAASEAVVTASEANVETIEDNIEDIWADVQVYGTPAFYDMGIFVGGTLADNEVVFRYAAPRGFTIAAGASGSASAGTAATGSTTLTIKKNGASIGTAVWSASGTVATLSITSETHFDAADVLSITNQGTTDTTLADVSITLVATRDP